MQITKNYTDDTHIKLTVVATATELEALKKLVLTRLAQTTVKVAGFREGKAPLALVEKQIDPERLQAEFLDEALNQLYIAAVDKEQLRPVAQPQVSIKKFVPFTTLEFEAEFEAIGTITLGDYKNLKLAKPEIKVGAKDVTDVIDNLATRVAEKTEVTRASKDGDQVTIDFSGLDAKTNAPIEGASGKDYPLLLGSNTFIPGFEPNLIDMKLGDKKTFTLTFPKDYGIAVFQSRKVEFTVTAKKVEAVIAPKIDDKFASTVGPFKTLNELKADIKKQLLSERHLEADRAYENELITQIANKSTVAIPKSLVDEQLDQMEQQDAKTWPTAARPGPNTWPKKASLKNSTAKKIELKPNCALKPDWS